MRKKDKKIIAICCADIHLSLNAPIWRSAEPDWFEAMKRPLDEIRELQEKYDCPVLCAGDIFHRWNSYPELINFALEYLPDDLRAVPGQHDLPLHNYEDIKRSAYWTLVQAGKIVNLPHELMTLCERKMNLTGFPFGYGIKKSGSKNNISFPQVPSIAIAHEYTWIKGHSYPNAPKENRLGGNTVKFINGNWNGFDIVIYGDNHKGFQYQFPKCKTQFFNCGTLMRRNSDEVDYRPQIGLIYADGNVKPHYLDTSKDKYLDIRDGKDEVDSLDIKGFIQELEKLGNSDLDFTEAMNQYLKKHNIKMPIINIIKKAMDL